MQEGFMLKKSLIFVSVALFLAALITLTGCPTTTDDGSSGTVYAHRIYGTAVSPYEVQEVIDRAIAAGEPVALEDGLTIAGPGQLNFKTAQVRIEGRVAFNGGAGVVSVVDAAVTWAEGSFLTLGAAGAYIHRHGTDTTKVTAGTPVEYAEGPEDIMATALKAGVRRFKLGPKQDFDYSVDPEGVDARIRAKDLTDLYVLDELTIDSSAAVPTVNLMAMGTVDVTGTPLDSVAFTNLAGVLPLGTCSTLTTSKGSVDVPVTASVVIPNIKVDAGKNFRVKPVTAAGTFTIGGKLTGAGTLEVSTDLTSITIGIRPNVVSGNGNVRFPDVDNSLVTVDIKSTGTVTFGGIITGLGNPSEIYGDVVFKDDVTVGDTLSLLGNVTLASGTLLTLSAIDLTLGANKTLSVEYTLDKGVSFATAPVWTTGPEGVVLTPAGATTLIFDATAPKDESAAKVLTLGAAAAVITDGTLRVEPGATLVIKEVALTTNNTVVANVPYIGYLAVADGGALMLDDTTGTYGSVVNTSTNTSITATSDATLTASGGTITLGRDTIEGSVAGAALIPTKGAAVFGVTGVTSLTLKRVDLNLASYGTISLAAAGDQVILTDRAKLTLSDKEGGTATALEKIGANITLSEGSLSLTDPASTAKTPPVWSVAQQGDTAPDVNIRATNAATITKSSKFE
jgi:hypothetical protein